MIVQGNDCACKFFKWLDTNTCTCGAVTTPIVLAKFRRLEHEVELTNEELKQACAMGEAAKWKVKRAKVARRISEEKVEKFKITLVISWVMFAVLGLGMLEASKCICLDELIMYVKWPRPYNLKIGDHLYYNGTTSRTNFCIVSIKIYGMYDIVLL